MRTRVVEKLYHHAFNSAEKFGPNSSEAGLFLLELMYTNYRAYDAICQDIAAYIIGG